MNRRNYIGVVVGIWMVTGLPGFATAAPFVSGSTGADGAFAPQASIQVQLPESGVLHYTTVNVPTGVTVTFKKNATNTPVTILATGDVIVNGTLDVSATDGASIVDAISADDTLPGVGGPGGANGGFGASKALPGTSGGGGLGPGAGKPGPGYFTGSATTAMSGGGGGFATDGTDASGAGGLKGLAYGSASSLPLIGGSGGGGGASTGSYSGSGGGGGGGAILIASSGSIQLAGAIKANGGRGGNAYTGTCSAAGGGGGGSGGAIRLIANAIAGGGSLSATGGATGNIMYVTSSGGCSSGAPGKGGDGRIRVEALTISLTGTTTPAVTAVFVPGQISVPGLPTLAITSVGGVTAPTIPTGTSDVTLPFNMANPVEVALSATGVPVGTVIKVTVTPYTGAVSSVTSAPLSGTTESSSATAVITLGGGHSVVAAAATFTVTQAAALGITAPEYIAGEPVEYVRLAAAFGGGATWSYVMKSGIEIPIVR